MAREEPFRKLLDETPELLNQIVTDYQAQLSIREIGTVKSVGQGVAVVEGLPRVRSEELLRFGSGSEGMAYNLDPGQLGIILLSEGANLRAGQPVYRTGRVLDTPVGEALLGRVVDALGNPIDEQGPVDAVERRPVEQPAQPMMNRAPVSEPLQTGIKVIDALIPIGLGQRELILGDRQIGKTALALDTIINQREKGMVCVYCAIGQRDAAVARFIADLRRFDALAYSIVVVASSDAPAGMQFVAPYAATTMAEYFMEQGRDVLIVYDDLTRHARAYRELSLLLRRPPGRQAYPGDIFYIHSRLLERATHLSDELGSGSLTALPIIETQSQNISAYVPTNLISITDGQIYLSPKLFQKGVLPAVDVGESVSRVGGKAQLPAYRTVAGDLRLAYSQFEELEVFSRFGTRLEEQTRRQLERGRRVREILKQPPYQPIPAAEQIIVLLAVTEGLLDDLPLAEIKDAEQALQQAFRKRLPGRYQDIQAGKELDEDTEANLLELARDVLSTGIGV
ncbi:MAG: alternate F1F0 ATPase, F1 subunit alpha [Anaerolineae bacterium]|nr:alternate F1F0 ATPase, F1 subunit alpha [Anaerolineae bacterium]